ncbi:bacteriohemerythrin [Thioalbus denitrificans]|uniref:Hemerythrin n=1 Tax=Thioalbus denitrificans TaxID=547122 RepID=A0A369CHT9_9GAMM|nr:hemerythrin family protein [Thioalbus denitrificans]RCX32236.1 hemerythrin [Thioalbus denitrificans]
MAPRPAAGLPSVGLEPIDAEHAQAVELMDRVRQALEHTPDRVQEHLCRLTGFLLSHFQREELLMREHGFFAFPLHKAEHLRVLEGLERARGQLERGDVETARGYLQETLPEWFHNHILTMDRVTGRCLLEAIG